VKFVRDMEKAGYDVFHYSGRYYWEGPAVSTSRRDGITAQDVIRATKVKLQHDSMGLDEIYYPVASDEGTRIPDEAEENSAD
jgi:hypothetical protein